MGAEQPELLAFKFRIIAEFDCLPSTICVYQPISTKPGQNVYDHDHKI